MKKLFTLLLCCMMLTGCAKSASMPPHTTAPEETHQTLPEDNPEIAQLDKEYAMARSDAVSNVERADVNTRFAESWMKLIEEYYQHLYDISPENMQILLEQDKEQWLLYSQGQIELEHARLDAVFGSGTIVPVLLSEFTYELNREKAVALIEMYEQMCSLK